MKKAKNLITLAIFAAFAINVAAGCGGGDAAATEAASGTEDGNSTIVIGASPTPHCEILEQAKPILAEEGIDIEIVTLEGSDTPNISLEDGSMDANFCQHQPYLDDWNKEHGSKLVSAGAVHYEPFGIYPGKTKDLSELPDGAKVALPNDVTNEARGLLLLQKEGLITLKEGVDIRATIQDIAENPKDIEFVEIAGPQLVKSLPDVDIAIINGNYAIQGGLTIADALAVESDQDIAAKTYANIVVVREGEEDSDAIKKLVEVLQSDEIRKFIEDTYNGSVVPIK